MAAHAGAERNVCNIVVSTVTMPLPRKVPDVRKKQIYVNAISR